MSSQAVAAENLSLFLFFYSERRHTASKRNRPCHVFDLLSQPPPSATPPLAAIVFPCFLLFELHSLSSSLLPEVERKRELRMRARRCLPRFSRSWPLSVALRQEIARSLSLPLCTLSLYLLSASCLIPDRSEAGHVTAHGPCLRGVSPSYPVVPIKE